MTAPRRSGARFGGKRHLDALKEIRIAAEVTALTDDTVRALQQSTRSRTVEYLCRAWLQFGAGSLTTNDLKKLTAAINARKGSRP